MYLQPAYILNRVPLLRDPDRDLIKRRARLMAALECFLKLKTKHTIFVSRLQWVSLASSKFISTLWHIDRSQPNYLSEQKRMKSSRRTNKGQRSKMEHGPGGGGGGRGDGKEKWTAVGWQLSMCHSIEMR
jgi:hypothetical protein